MATGGSMTTTAVGGGRTSTALGTARPEGQALGSRRHMWVLCPQAVHYLNQALFSACLSRAGLVSSWRGNQPLVGNRRATLEAQEAPSGAGTQPLAGNATLAVARRDSLLALR